MTRAHRNERGGRALRERAPFDHPASSILPVDIEGVDSLAELALDMWWSWSHATDEVWRQLDPALWEITHNPWVVLQTVSRDQIARVLSDPVFRRDVDDLLQTRRDAMEAPAWFQQNHARSPLTCAAYFSMEFMLSEGLPIYSGGLGRRSSASPPSSCWRWAAAIRPTRRRASTWPIWASAGAAR